MKALTDKIIECLKNKHDSFIGSLKNNETIANSEGFKEGLAWAIGTIESLENTAEFEEVTRVVMKHLLIKNYHPHHTVILTNSTAELLEGKISAGIVDDYIPVLSKKHHIQLSYYF